MTFRGFRARLSSPCWRFLCCFILLSGFACDLPQFRAGAQTASTIQGTVTDAQRAVLPGAKVEIASPQLGLRRSASADSNGRYLVAGLVPGIYDIEVSASGFAAKKFEKIEVTVNQSLRFDATLSVASVQAEVVVSGETPLLDGLTNGTDYTKGVNHFQVPAYSDMDIRVAKAFNFTERTHLDLYFEYYNLFNTDNPAAVESLPDQPVAFGGKLQVLPGREGQVGLHFTF